MDTKEKKKFKVTNIKIKYFKTNLYRFWLKKDLIGK